MATVSVTSKGQVTIPKRVRQALGIMPGSKVEFDLESGCARLKVVKRQVGSRGRPGDSGLQGSAHSDCLYAWRVGDDEGGETCAPLTPTCSRAITCATMRRRRAASCRQRRVQRAFDL